MVDATFEGARQWNFLDELQGLGLFLGLNQRQKAEACDKYDRTQNIQKLHAFLRVAISLLAFGMLEALKLQAGMLLTWGAYAGKRNNTT